MIAASGLEPRAAGGELAHARRLMDPPLAALHELEMLHGVRDVDPLAVQADLGQRAVEDLTGRADERRALEVFLVSRLLAHEHDPRVGRAAAEDRLRGVAIELAAGAPRGGGAELGHAGVPRNGRRRALAFAIGEGIEPAHSGIVLGLEEIVVLVNEAPEDLPARGIGRGGHVARDVQKRGPS